MVHIGWFVLGQVFENVGPYKYGDVFLSVYSKKDQLNFYTDKGCKLVPVYVDGASI